MKKMYCCAFIALAMLLSPGFRTSAMSDAKVRVNIGVQIPALIFPAPPPLLPIPGAYVYYPPDVNVDIFFYHDRWYRPHAGRWYRADNYNGPWHTIHGKQIPQAVVRIPPSYRAAGHRYKKISYKEVRRSHRAWEKNHHWDRDKSQSYKQPRGEGHRQKKDRKEDQYKADHHKPDHRNGKDR